MLHPSQLLKAPFKAGWELLFPAVSDDALQAGAPSRASSVIVPIRSIGPRHGERIATHLLALSKQDRYLRFGFAASDEQIHRYVNGLNFERDDIFGVYNRKLELIAMAHLAFSTDPDLKSCAEFGVSVLAHARGRGYGARLFDRAVMHARNEGVQMMFIHALSENTAMLNIARKAGATIERDGTETEAYLTLQPADLDSRVSEMLEEQLAQVNYGLKAKARQFRNLLARIQYGGPPGASNCASARRWQIQLS